MSRPAIELTLSFKEYLIAIIEMTDDIEEITFIELQPSLLAKKVILMHNPSCWKWEIIIESEEGIIESKKGILDYYVFKNGDLEFIKSEYLERGGIEINES